MGEILWNDRKRTLFGLPLSFTKYSLTEDKLIIERGIFNRIEEEIRLYRIFNIPKSITYPVKYKIEVIHNFMG